MFGGGRNGARGSNRSGGKGRAGGGGGGGKTGAAAPVYALPIHDKPYIVSTWKTLGGKGNANPKWNDNSKGIIANYLGALGLPITYKGGKAAVGSFIGFRYVACLPSDAAAYP